jgi:thiamine-phosphate pyrophosphorylase
VHQGRLEGEITLGVQARVTIGGKQVSLRQTADALANHTGPWVAVSAALKHGEEHPRALASKGAVVITDRASAATRGRGLVETLARALTPDARGVAVLVREKGAPLDDVRALCGALRPIAKRAGALLLVHTHVTLVRELGLDGAHVSSTGEPRKARALLRRGALLGVSRHDGDAIDEGVVDYSTLSPIFAPSSKPGDARATLGLDALGARCRASPTPVVALGGIAALSARGAFGKGAAAVAVVGAVMAAHDPRRALMELISVAGADLAPRRAKIGAGQRAH